MSAAGPYVDDDGTWLPIPDDARQDRELDSLTVGGDPVASTSTHYLAEPRA